MNDHLINQLIKVALSSLVTYLLFKSSTIQKNALRLVLIVLGSISLVLTLASIAGLFMFFWEVKISLIALSLFTVVMIALCLRRIRHPRQSDAPNHNRLDRVLELKIFKNWRMVLLVGITFLAGLIVIRMVQANHQRVVRIPIKGVQSEYDAKEIGGMVVRGLNRQEGLESEIRRTFPQESGKMTDIRSSVQSVLQQKGYPPENVFVDISFSSQLSLRELGPVIAYVKDVTEKEITKQSGIFLSQQSKKASKPLNVQ